MIFRTENNVECFRETVPILVQPKLVLFPGTSQLIAVASQSLGNMANDALRTNGLIAVAADTTPERDDDHARQIVSLTQIVAPAYLSASSHHLHIRGISRARVLAVSEMNESYEHATVEVARDHYAPQPVIDRCHRHDELSALFRGLFSHIQRNDLFQLWDAGECPLGALCDLIGDMLPVEPRRKQRLLAELDVDLRSDLLLEILRDLTRGHSHTHDEQSAIPQFSLN